MAKKVLTRTPDFPYHITSRSNNKDFFYVELEYLWLVFMECFEQAQHQYNCELHAFVLMSNHYHLLISTPHSNIDAVMQHVQREVARKANKKASRINHFFGGPYKWSIIYEESYYWNALKYIFRNPVRAGLCESVGNYKFSSLNTKAKNFQWSLTDIFSDKSKLITLDDDWLNEPYLNEIESDIRMALRRKEFQIPRNKSGHRSSLDAPHFKKGGTT